MRSLSFFFGQMAVGQDRHQLRQSHLEGIDRGNVRPENLAVECRVLGLADKLGVDLFAKNIWEN